MLPSGPEDAGKGDVVAKLLPLLAEPGKRRNGWTPWLPGLIPASAFHRVFFGGSTSSRRGGFGTAAVFRGVHTHTGGAVAACRRVQGGGHRRSPTGRLCFCHSPPPIRTAPWPGGCFEVSGGAGAIGLTTLALAQSLVNSGDLRGPLRCSRPLDTLEVRDFLVETAPRFVVSWEINRSLALSRLLTGGSWRVQDGGIHRAGERAGKPARKELAAGGTGARLRKADPETNSLRGFHFGAALAEPRGQRRRCRLLRMDPRASLLRFPSWGSTIHLGQSPLWG
jgi:hypothetical protein